MHLEPSESGEGDGVGGAVLREHPLSDLQQAYLLGRDLHVPLGGVAMQEFRAYRGAIDIDALRRRLLALVERHDALRTRIDVERRVAWVSNEPTCNYDEVDLRGESVQSASERIEALREGYAYAVSGLSRPPWNVTAFRLPSDGPGQDTGVVFARFDALILDGHAIASVMVDLLGGDALRLREASAPPIRAGPRRQRDAAYWAAKLAGVEGPPRLPWKRPLQGIPTSRYDRVSLSIDAGPFKAFCRLSAGENLFRGTAVTAVILAVLARWLSDGTLCVGIPVAPNAAGPLANRSSFIAANWDERCGSLRERAQALQSDVLEGLEHLAQAGVHLSRLLMSAHPGAGPPLPVVVTNSLSWPKPDRRLGLRPDGGLTQTPQVAMDIRFSEEDGGLVIDIDHAREAIDRRVVRDILDAIDRQIRAICARGRFEVGRFDVPVPAPPEPDQGRSADPTAGFLRRIADRLVAGGSSRTALICGANRISYAELGARVSRAAATLRGCGVGSGDVVAIVLPRGPAHTAITLACALAGAIWVPIDAASPPERLAYLLANCRPALVVTEAPAAFGHRTATPDALLAGETPPDPWAFLPDLDALSRSEAPAYYLYTSGTTGRPKCVVLSNRATANVIDSTLSAWRIDERDVFISVTPLHHDMSVFDVFGCLAAGGMLVQPARGEEKDALAWNRLVAEHGVTLWCSVPAILEMLLACRSGESLRTLRLIAQGGDYIKPATIAELRGLDARPRLISLGGPTETTIWSIWHEIAAADVEGVPYGRPLPGNRYFLLNARGEHCPPLVAGRMHTAGVNVALGYLQDGSLTQTDFVTVEDEAGQPVRAFRTGDCGYRRHDGTIVFASRIDGYVKVRGVRVSLPDIEAELAGHPDLRKLLIVAVGAERQGEIEIGMVYVPAEAGCPSTAALRAHARRVLPDSHVPTRFLAVDALPLSANGKPDRHRARALIETARGRCEPAQAALVDGDRIRRILDLYLGAMGQSPAPGIDEATEFVGIGLLPSHLKTIAAGLRDAFGAAVMADRLLRCRNAGQVNRLLRDQSR